MTRRRYDKRTKLAAVAEAEINGTESASRKLGIPRTTIITWRDNPAYDELRQKTREDLAEGFRVLALLSQEELMRRVSQGDIDSRDLSLLLGISTDKSLLMSGEAIGRTEHRALAEGLDDDTRKRLRDWLDRRLDPKPRDADGIEEGAGAEVR